MPISANSVFCASQGYPVAPCWYNYTLSTNTSSAFPNPVGIVQQNLPWFGMGIWLVTYAALFLLFNKSGGREKFMAIGIGGFLATIVYAQVGVLGIGASEIGVFSFAFFILIISIVAYSLVKDNGE